ncbi:efflux RND transporter periplasmic adaptor subunit [Sphingomonas sp. HDW15A]|uniref:efflux RND transporter periplasmic adaptor subunit n=1 Tax=Sphingomonas sp. HDW15A TaxID=2714942 RepID=UPI001408ADA5|nr:efflux RND transporter periplasmic adaptor subunit [Sphingomonas sp. HDW15A]QIK96569.1 efflux RND transporter periplasmic adaptor subunit [Sphingomonas sp. HDW15A]
MPRLAYAILALVVIAGAAAFILLRRPETLQGTYPSIGPAVDVVYATGFVEPREPVEIASRVTAPIVRIHVKEGDRVQRGQPLVSLESSEQLQAVGELSARSAQARKDEERALAIYKRGFLAVSARDRAMSEARSALAAELVARARLSQFAIRSSISGVVLRRDAEIGDLATPTRTILVIGDPSRVRVTATVDERDIPRVLKGQQALMSSDAYKGRVFRGSVYEITPGGDPNQRAFRVRIRPDESQVLPIGLTLEVNIVTASRQNALLVPAGAVRDERIWTVRDGRAVRIPVTAGIEGRQKREILRGIDRSTCVLTNPPEKLKENARIQVEGC